MPILMAICPRCRTEVNTGIITDQHTVKELAPSFEVLVLCDYCRDYQKMLVQDLRLAAEDAVA